MHSLPHPQYATLYSSKPTFPFTSHLILLSEINICSLLHIKVAGTCQQVRNLRVVDTSPSLLTAVLHGQQWVVGAVSCRRRAAPPILPTWFRAADHTPSERVLAHVVGGQAALRIIGRTIHQLLGAAPDQLTIRVQHLELLGAAIHWFAGRVQQLQLLGAADNVV